MYKELEEVVATIQKIKAAGQFSTYIDFIQFPYYRNLEINTKIQFDFPLTVFVGQNGCGKSSSLHALYGCVQNKTPYEFWFDTKVDPIEYYDDEKRRHSFWYSYKDGKSIKQVVKARIKRGDNPNYWETSRPLVWAGMLKKGTKRDSPIKKKVIYLDFRGELSAFDKFFYFGNLKHTKSRNKQEFIRRKSTSLNNLFAEKSTEICSKRGPLNKPLEKLSTDELKAISFILGRNYNAGKAIKHSIFRNEGYSVLFETDFARYSEAFAGSGEMAVVRLVQEVINAEACSLILLDEPEVSLHPGAQERLKMFLLEQVKNKKHQVVITSHSPSIINGLPANAIKVFYHNPSNGRFLVKENMLPEEAFYHLEAPIDNRRSIIVEDILAKQIVEAVLERMGEETKELFVVSFNPGGESVIKKEFITVFCRENHSKNYIVFDGDQRSNHLDWRELSTSELSLQTLKKKVKDQTREDIKFSVDGGEGGSNESQQLELLKKYLDYFKNNVFYLPKKIPEDIIWDEGKAEQLISFPISNTSAVASAIKILDTIKSTKEKFSKLTEVVYNSNTSSEISAVHKLFIQYWAEQQNDDFMEIKGAINTILKRH